MLLPVYWSLNPLQRFVRSLYNQPNGFGVLVSLERLSFALELQSLAHGQAETLHTVSLHFRDTAAGHEAVD
jgi:hypothetical protein